MVFTLQKNDFTLKDEQRCGHSKELNSEELLAVINEDPSKTSRKLGIEFNVSHTSILHEMARLDEVSKAGKWVPHELTENNYQQRAYLYFHFKTTKGDKTLVPT